MPSKKGKQTFWLFIYLPYCQSVCVSVSLLVCLYVSLCVCLSICPFIAHLFVRLTVWLLKTLSTMLPYKASHLQCLVDKILHLGGGLNLQLGPQPSLQPLHMNWWLNLGSIKMLQFEMFLKWHPTSILSPYLIKHLLNAYILFSLHLRGRLPKTKI